VSEEFKNRSDANDGRELRISPGLSIRIDGESALVQGGVTQKVIEIPVDGLAILVEFASPKRVQDVLAGYGESLSSNIDAFISNLFKMGVLVDSSCADSPIEADSSRVCQHFIEPLADAVYRLAADVRALSPDDQRRFFEEHDYTVDAALGEICASVSRLETNLLQIQKTRRPPTFVKEAGELRLNIGSRNTRIRGWTNVDVYPADVCCNISRKLPFENGSVSHAFMAHVLEHFFYPEEALKVLREVRRVLKPGASLRVVVPDIRKYLFAYIKGTRSVFDDKNARFGLHETEETMLEQLLIYAGVGPAPGCLINSHKFGYDFETLKKTLLTAGFSSVAESNYMESTVPELRVDDASYIAAVRSGQAHLSLFVDAWA
jgi:hypothetical protein